MFACKCVGVSKLIGEVMIYYYETADDKKGRLLAGNDKTAKNFVANKIPNVVLLYVKEGADKDIIRTVWNKQTDEALEAL